MPASLRWFPAVLLYPVLAAVVLPAARMLDVAGGRMVCPASMTVGSGIEPVAGAVG
jgi:hypothetical protein